MTFVVIGNTPSFNEALNATKDNYALISDWELHYDGSGGSFSTTTGVETPTGRWLALRSKTDNNSPGTVDNVYMYLILEIRGSEFVIRTAQAVTSAGAASGVTPYASATKTTMLATPFNLYLNLEKNSAGVILAFSSTEKGALLSTYQGVLTGGALDNAYCLINIETPTQAWCPATTGVTAGVYTLHTLGESESDLTLNSVLEYEVGNPTPVSSPPKAYFNTMLLSASNAMLGAVSSVFRTKNSAYETADISHTTIGSESVILRIVKTGEYLLAFKE